MNNFFTTTFFFTNSTSSFSYLNMIVSKPCLRFTGLISRAAPPDVESGSASLVSGLYNFSWRLITLRTTLLQQHIKGPVCKI